MTMRQLGQSNGNQKSRLSKKRRRPRGRNLKNNQLNLFTGEDDVIQVQSGSTSRKKTTDLQGEAPACTRCDTGGDHPNNFGAADNDRDRLERGITSATVEREEIILFAPGISNELASGELHLGKHENEPPVFLHQPDSTVASDGHDPCRRDP